MVNYQVGFKKMDEFVHYFVNGMPVYCHEQTDKNDYRFALATLVNNKFCSIRELSDALGVNKKNVERYAKDLMDKGMSHFFNRKEARGQCHKFTPEKIRKINEVFFDVLQVFVLFLPVYECRIFDKPSVLDSFCSLPGIPFPFVQLAQNEVVYYAICSVCVISGITGERIRGNSLVATIR